MYLVYAKECIWLFIEKGTKIQPSFSKKKETGLTRWLASYFVFIQKQTGNFLYTQTKFLPVVGGAVEGKTGRKSSLHKSSFLQHFTESSLACT